MAGHTPTIDSTALARLRTLVAAMHENDSPSLPMERLVRLAHDVRLDVGVTVDFAASSELGSPMVVLRFPEALVADESLASLSSREREVATLVARGKSNKQIARSLFISESTVKDHVHNILGKSGLPNRAAVAAAHRRSGTPQTDPRV